MTGTRLGQVPTVASWMQYGVETATEPEHTLSRFRGQTGARGPVGLGGPDWGASSSGTASGVSAGTGELLPFSVHRGHAP